MGDADDNADDLGERLVRCGKHLLTHTHHDGEGDYILNRGGGACGFRALVVCSLADKITGFCLVWSIVAFCVINNNFSFINLCTTRKKSTSQWV